MLSRKPFQGSSSHLSKNKDSGFSKKKATSRSSSRHSKLIDYFDELQLTNDLRGRSIRTILPALCDYYRVHSSRWIDSKMMKSSSYSTIHGNVSSSRKEFRKRSNTRAPRRLITRENNPPAQPYLRNVSGLSDVSDNCLVCGIKPRSTVFQPCGHVSYCKTCSAKLFETTCFCPTCKTKIKSTLELTT